MEAAFGGSPAVLAFRNRQADLLVAASPGGERSKALVSKEASIPFNTVFLRATETPPWKWGRGESLVFQRSAGCRNEALDSGLGKPLRVICASQRFSLLIKNVHKSPKRSLLYES